jgi:isopropylmalate/homocitrate/citramalate synthase
MEVCIMTSQPWKTDQWFTSPWNFTEQARAGLEFAPSIQIHDVTLRDGEQQAGIEFTTDDKVRIAEGLAQAGVHRIEAGLPAVSPSDEAAVREIVKRELGPQVFAFARCMKSDVALAADCGVSGVVMEIPSSPHIIEYAYRWPLQRAIDASIETTAYAHELGLEVVFFPIDFSRADFDWVLNLLTRVANDGHMDALVLVDTFGVLAPQAMPNVVQQVRSRIPDKRLEVHVHMDYSLGVANTIAALGAGVEVAHTTITGIGERSGNTPMEDVVMALLTLYGVDTGIKTEALTDLSHLVRELSGVAVPPNRGIVGDLVYAIESGIIASWFKNCGEEHLTEVFPYRPELVGQRSAQVVLGKNSGIDSIGIWLDRLGISASEEQRLELLRLVKEQSLEQKGLLSEDQFVRLVDAVVSQTSRAAPALSGE